MRIPRSALEPFGFTGIPIVTEESIGWIKCNNELAEAISARLEEDDRGTFYAPYVPKQLGSSFEPYDPAAILQTLPPKKRERILAVLDKVRRQIDGDS